MKISAFPFASSFDPGDVLLGDVGGVTMQLERVMLLGTLGGIGTCIYVDGYSGDDASARKYCPLLPYAHLQAAQAVASAGDTIVVFPYYYYPPGNLAKDQVNWYFLPGCEIVYNPVNAATALFDAPGFTTRIYGYGRFHTNLTGTVTATASLIRAAGSGSSVTLEADLIDEQRANPPYLTISVDAAATFSLKARTVNKGSYTLHGYGEIGTWTQSAADAVYFYGSWTLQKLLSTRANPTYFSDGSGYVRYIDVGYLALIQNTHVVVGGHDTSGNGLQAGIFGQGCRLEADLHLSGAGINSGQACLTLQSTTDARHRGISDASARTDMWPILIVGVGCILRSFGIILKSNPASTVGCIGGAAGAVSIQNAAGILATVAPDPGVALGTVGPAIVVDPSI
jgi:hypothetical protein